jgi:hypothetical protein
MWCYTKKVDKKGKTRYNRIKHLEGKEMPRKKSTRYTEEFKKTIVNLHPNGKSLPTSERLNSTKNESHPFDSRLKT